MPLGTHDGTDGQRLLHEERRHGAPPARAPGHSGTGRTTKSPPPFLHWTAPPYTDFAEVRVCSNGGAAPLPPGSVLALRLVSPAAATVATLAVAHRWRSTLRTAPLVLQLGFDGPQALRFVALAAEWGVHGVLAEGEPITALRAALAPRSAPGEAVLRWHAEAGQPFTARAAALVRKILDSARDHASLASLCRSAHVCEPTERKYLHKHRLPAPRAWFQLGRGLQAVRAIQTEPEKPLDTLASDLGYSDAASLSRHVLRTFGVRPGRVRETMGWQWLAARWAERAGRTVTNGG